MNAMKEVLCSLLVLIFISGCVGDNTLGTGDNTTSERTTPVKPEITCTPSLSREYEDCTDKISGFIDNCTDSIIGSPSLTEIKQIELSNTGDTCILELTAKPNPETDYSKFGDGGKPMLEAIATERSICKVPLQVLKETSLGSGWIYAPSYLKDRGLLEYCTGSLVERFRN